MLAPSCLSNHNDARNTYSCAPHTTSITLAASPHKFRRTIHTRLNVLSLSSPRCPAADLCRLPHKPPFSPQTAVFPTNPRPTPASTIHSSGTQASPLVRPQPLSPQARMPLPRTYPRPSPLNRSLINSITTSPHSLSISIFSPCLRVPSCCLPSATAAQASPHVDP